MKPVLLHSLATPSPALLRFLKAQTEVHSASFLSSNAPVLCRRAPHYRSCLASTSSTPRHPPLPPSTREASPIVTSPQWPYSKSLASPVRSSCLDARNLSRSPRYEMSHHLPFTYPRRPFTSGAQKGFWNLRGLKKQKPVVHRQRSDLPPLASFLDDNGGLGRVSRPTNELKLRCTEFDESGNVTLINGEFKKSELIAKVRCFAAVSYYANPERSWNWI
jgi:magnesium transporter